MRAPAAAAAAVAVAAAAAHVARKERGQVQSPNDWLEAGAAAGHLGRQCRDGKGGA